MLNVRLRQLGLRPVDVGDGGNCFFRPVSHQLYGDPSHHLLIRKADVQYLGNNPERFVESNTENSWNKYMSGFMKTVWKISTSALSGRFFFSPETPKSTI